MVRSLQNYPWRRLAIGFAIAFFVSILTLALNRYYSFYSSFDQGIFNQVFWNGIHGRFFQSSLSSSLSTNVVLEGQLPEVFYRRLGQHFTPALLLWLPLYSLFPNAATLTVLQVTLIASAGIVLYFLARHHLNAPLSILVIASYYTANAVIGPTLGNFSDLCQIPLYVFGLLLAMEKRQWWLFSLLTVLILAVREDAGVVLFGIGCYLVMSKRYPRIGLAICSLSFVYMVCITTWVMPLFSQDIPRRFLVQRFSQFTNGEEASSLDILWGIVSRPWRLIIELLSPVPKTVQYLLGQWLPLAFIPVISPAAWIVACFPLAQILLQQGDGALTINLRYAITVVPGLFYGAILWLAQHPEIGKKHFKRIWLACISLSLLFSLTSNPHQALYFAAPESFRPWVYMSLPKQWNHTSHIRLLLNQIPDNASVSATTYLVPALSSRREVLRFPGLALIDDARQQIQVDYIVADLWWLQQYQAAFKSKRQSLQTLVPAIEQLLARGEYGLIDFKQGVVLFQRAVRSEPTATAAWRIYRQEINSILQQPNDKNSGA